MRECIRAWDGAFFRSVAEGVFDEGNLIFRTKELNQFLMEMYQESMIFVISFLIYLNMHPMGQRLLCTFQT